MEFISLASSSKGNAYIVDDGKTKLLIECGIPFGRIKKKLNFDLTRIAGCLVTHEHMDHAKAHKEVIKSGIPLYMTEGTAIALEQDLAEIITPKEPFISGTFKILPFTTFHDAKEPVGFLIESLVDGQRLQFITDTVNCNVLIPNINILAIECNYCEEILNRHTMMPAKVVYRIKNSHFEYRNTKKFIERMNKSSLKTIYLTHLSGASSNEVLFLQELQFPGIKTVVCNEDGGFYERRNFNGSANR